MPNHVAFLNWLTEWYADLPTGSLAKVVEQAGDDPHHVAVLVVDLLVGFCSEGALASPRIGRLAAPAARFLTQAQAAGIPHFLFASDAHPADAVEFRSFPPHCIRGSAEAELIPALAALPFAGAFTHFPKNSLNVGAEPPFDEWRRRHPEVNSWILIGDCTDLCVYHAAMHLRLQANATNQETTIWVPADLVDTYDLPVEAARSLGAFPHDGDLLHQLFLYHMALNGVRVVRSLE